MYYTKGIIYEFLICFVDFELLYLIDYYRIDFFSHNHDKIFKSTN